MRTKLIKGILLIVIPLAIIVGVGLYYYGTAPQSQIASLNRSFAITIDHPPPNFFDRSSQLLVGFGLCLASICWGVAKIIGAVRGK